MSVHPERLRGQVMPSAAPSDEPLPAPIPSALRLRNSIAAHILHSRYDSRELTAPARAAFDQKFLDQVDPSGLLPEGERKRRAAHLRRAYFQKLALRSAEVRRARTQRRNGEEQ